MKSIKTVNLKANEIQAVEMPDLHCHVRNGGTATVFASRYSDVAPYTDGVLEIKSGDSKVVRNIFDYQTRQGFVYLFSESDTSVELESANDVNFFSRKIISGGESTGSVDTYNRSEINAMLSEKADNSDLKTVAKTGSYNDLSDKPEIPVVDVDKSYVDNALKEKADNSDVEEVSNAVNTHINNASIHITADEKEKLANLENYDDTEIKADIAKKVDKKDGYSLVSDTEITRLAEVDNYNDMQVKNDIALNLSSIGMSRKNLLKPTCATSKVNEVTFTVNSDNSVTITGTATADADYYILGMWDKTTRQLAEQRDYIISFGSEFENAEMEGYVITNGNHSAKAFTTSSTGWKEGKSEWTQMTCLMVRVPSGVTVQNVTIYPMIRYADITDDTYEPYTPSLQEQIDNISSLNVAQDVVAKDSLCAVRYPETKILTNDLLYCAVLYLTTIVAPANTKTTIATTQTKPKYTLSQSVNIYTNDNSQLLGTAVIEISTTGNVSINPTVEIPSNTYGRVMYPIQILALNI